MPPEPMHTLIRTCALATGLTLNEVVKIAAIGPKRYKVYQIPKRSGGQRTICHPSRELKALQYVFLREILRDLPVHESATAYKSGSSIKQNAAVHASSRVILKLDFENFFPSIKVSDWKIFAQSKFPNWSKEDVEFSAYVLFWGAGNYVPNCLSIGAPTSPLISNSMLYKFDDIMSQYANGNGLCYTRYADDITISSKENLNKEEAVNAVKLALAELSSPAIQLNVAKTKLVSKSTSRRVTGLVLSNEGKVSLGRNRKRLIGAMVHHALTGKADPESLGHLAGLLSFATDIEPTFVDALHRKHGRQAIEALQLRKSD
jgi:RNA-directed DNA polymerase